MQKLQHVVSPLTKMAFIEMPLEIKKSIPNFRLRCGGYLSGLQAMQLSIKCVQMEVCWYIRKCIHT